MAGDKFEQLGPARTQHTSWSGIDITRTFYVEPYTRFVQVVAQLQGQVEGGTLRHPARDSYIKSAYCNEAIVDFVDRDGISTSKTLSTGNAIKDQLEDIQESTTDGAAGCKIVAHYRPLITAWQPSEGGPFSADPVDNIWDWIDPVVQPGVRQVPWPGGIYGRVPRLGFDKFTFPDEVAQPIGIAVSDVSIRRLFVPEVPWNEIAQCANAVNLNIWPADAAIKGLPRFPPRTLKYAGTTVDNRLDSIGRRWVELTHRFKWVQHTSDRLFDEGGNRQEGFVTWDHALASPRGAITGWYPQFMGTEFNVGPFAVKPVIAGLTAFAGLIHNAVNFDVLFRR